MKKIMKESLFESTMRRTKEIIQKNGSVRSLAEKLETNPSTITRWFAEEGRAPRFDALAKIFEFFSVEIVFPGENQKLDEVKNLENQIKILTKKLEQAEKQKDLLEAQVSILKEVIQPAQAPPTSNGEYEKRSA